MDNNENKAFDYTNTHAEGDGAEPQTSASPYKTEEHAANAAAADASGDTSIYERAYMAKKAQMASNTDTTLHEGEYAFTRDTMPSQVSAVHHTAADAAQHDASQTSGFQAYSGNANTSSEYVRVDADRMEAEQVHSPLPNQDKSSQTGGINKVKKSKGRFSKIIATALVAAIIGGCAGGAAGYMAASGKGHGYVSTVSSSQNNGVDVTYGEDGNMTISSIAEVAVPAVVSIYNIGTNTDFFGRSTGESAKGYGSGVLISSDGTIVTNYHVIEGSSRLTVVTNAGDEYEATVLGSDSNLDLAVLKIDGKDLPYVDIADSDQIKVGDMAVAIGNPVDAMFSQTVTDGIISGVDRKLSSESGTIGYLQTNASINSGNSGGALLNGQAQLIGINSMKIMSTGVEGMGFAIPGNVVADFVNKVVSGELDEEAAQKPWLGISGYSLTEEIAAQLNTSYTSGLLIAEVVDAGPAAGAGLQSGDILIGIDGKEIKTFEDLSDYLKNKAPGDTVTLTVVRGDQTAEVDVKLGTQAQQTNN